jgi:predicted nucleic acid-binding protein
VKLFDTSSLIAAMLEDHKFHEAAQKIFLEARDAGTGCVSSHSIAELYSVLSGMPRKPKISPQIAKHMIEVNLERFQKVSLEASDYAVVLNRIVTLQLSGGVVFDALIAHCALKIGADAIVTLNAKHFQRLGADVSALVIEP